jgi:hypothetical protein
LAFFLNSLDRNFFKRERLSPPPEAGLRTELIDKLIALLFQLAAAESPDPEQIHRVFQALRVEQQWNPLAALAHRFYHSFEMMAAVLELQLADLLYLHRRSLAKGVRHTAFRDLYDELERLRQLALTGGLLDEDLAGNLIFHCLKMAEFFRDTRRYDCLRTVYALTKFMVQIRSRVGADINRRLDALAGNADVMFYLNVRLGRDLHDANALERATLNLLQRRLSTIADYVYPGATEESVRVARIGRHLKQFVRGLEAEAPPDEASET